MRVHGTVSAWVELRADHSRLRPSKPELSADANALIVYMAGNSPYTARKHQLGNGLLFDEGIHWCYADDEDAVIAMRAASALT